MSSNNNNSNNNNIKSKTVLLRIASWNVAGWSATSNIIRTLYNGKLSTFLNNFHDADIIALQEVKGNGGMKKLRQDPVASGACDSSKSGLTLPGWETFWAHSDPQFKGFNGVAIFAKTGLVVGADPRPLRDAELDAEGRCMLAVTKTSCVFSVYAPAASGKNRTELRAKFFTALADAVQRAREDYGKPIVLCGDLNATYRPADCHWSWRRFSFEKLKSKDLAWPSWFSENYRKDLIKDVEEWIQTQKDEKEKQQQVDKNNKSGENSFPRRNHNNNNVELNDEKNEPVDHHQDEAEDEDDDNNNNKHAIVIDDEHWWIDTFCSSDLTAWKSRRWYPISQLAFYDQDEEVRSVVQHTHCDGKINMEKLFSVGLIDSLLEIHPDTNVNRGLFTCFNQSRNERYNGVGQRIDYILTDPCLVKNGIASQKTEQEKSKQQQNQIQQNNNNNICPQTEFHSMENGHHWRRLVNAATSNKLFVPAPTDGGGMSKLEWAQCEKSLEFILPEPQMQQQQPEQNINDGKIYLQAGVLYTAPQLSDHVAVFCDVLLLNDLEQEQGKSGNDSDQNEQQQRIKKQFQLLEEKTKNCKYVSTMRSITSFFAPSTSTTTKPKITTSSTTTQASLVPQRRDRDEKAKKGPVEVIELD